MDNLSVVPSLSVPLQVELKGAPELAMERTEQVLMIILDAVTPVEEPRR